MIEVQDRPQILQHLEKSLNVTIYDTKCVFLPIFFLLHCLIVLLKFDHPEYIGQRRIQAACRWMPCSAKFVAIGAHARMTGVFQVGTISCDNTCLLQHPSQSLARDNY
jgi:hypothetical protein